MAQRRNRIPAARPRRRKREKKSTWNIFNIIIIVLLLFGGVVICQKLYQLWEIHRDMQMTLQQEEMLQQEQERLKVEKNHLEDPEEITKEARERFGLVKSGEIPYKQ